jgi:hypothetical protein
VSSVPGSLPSLRPHSSGMERSLEGKRVVCDTGTFLVPYTCSTGGESGACVPREKVLILSHPDPCPGPAVALIGQSTRRTAGRTQQSLSLSLCRKVTLRSVGIHAVRSVFSARGGYSVSWLVPHGGVAAQQAMCAPCPRGWASSVGTAVCVI